MKRDGEAFIGIDTVKPRNAVAVAEAGRNGEIRIDNPPDVAIEHLYSPFTDEKNRALQGWFEY